MIYYSGACLGVEKRAEKGEKQKRKDFFIHIVEDFKQITVGNEREFAQFLKIWRRGEENQEDKRD